MSNDNASRSVLILGATSAMARATAAAFAEDGHPIILGGHDAAENDLIAADLRVRYGGPVYTVPFDARDFPSHAHFWEDCTAVAGAAPHGVLIFFGYMVEQDVAQEQFAEARATISINLTAVISVLEPFARVCEQRREGFIGVVSSVAGDRGRQSNYIYGASKAGLSAYTQGLRNRLHKVGVPVTTIKPGFVDTKMTFGLPLPKPLVASPAAAGKAIHRAVSRGQDVAYVPFFWRYIMLIIRSIPEWQFKKMKL